MSKTIIHWFRKGLRIHDNPALLKAIDLLTEKHVLRPIFILDPKILKWLRVGSNRWRFLQQSLNQLNENLKKIGSQLYVIRGNPENVFRRIFLEWNVTTITFEIDTEPYAKKRDQEIESIAKIYKIDVIKCVSHTIYDTDLVLLKNNGKPPLTYQKFLSVISKLPPPTKALPAPDQLPPSSVPTFDSIEKTNKNCYDIPTLQELGVNENELDECLYNGGENEALNRLSKYMKMKTWICKFEKPNTLPNSLEPSTTVLSPYLKFGCISAKLFYHELKKTIGNSSHTKPPVSLEGQLMWREFYYVVSVATPNFDKMEGNSICCQIPWDTNNTYLEAWTYGRTGYPFIDAIMRQLRKEGWIHHLARHAVACFLTRGDLWISWEEGQKVFEELLLDADWALNAGNWMWLSASAFFHQFFRVYSPVAFGKKTDKTGDYIKKYVPEVKKYPAEYIYEPWKAPISVQKIANCVIGKDYPHRIVIHEDVYKVNISKMSLAYKNNKTVTTSTQNETVKRKISNEKLNENKTDKKMKQKSLKEYSFKK